jgi:NAD/NADP transhydrogenase alpha subunit
MTTAVIQRQAGVGARRVPPARRVPRAARRARRLRPTLLARRLLALVITLVIVSMVVWTATALHSEASSDAGVVAATVVVGAGETVWDIAANYVPAGETAHGYVARVLRYNDIDAAAVAPGTVLQLPRS